MLCLHTYIIVLYNNVNMKLLVAHASDISLLVLNNNSVKKINIKNSVFLRNVKKVVCVQTLHSFAGLQTREEHAHRLDKKQLYDK